MDQTMTLSLRKAALILVTLLLSSCAGLQVQTCGGNEKNWFDELRWQLGFGNNDRIRNNLYRMELAYPGHTAEKLYPFAAMSELAYYDYHGEGRGQAREGICKDMFKPKFEPGSAEAEQSKTSCQTVLDLIDGWTLDTNGAVHTSHNDDEGFAYQIWRLETEHQVEVVIAYRGTDQFGDFLDGNLPPLFQLSDDNQQRRARHQAKPVIEALQNSTNKPLTIYTTGHSLGGGLAQHVYYAFPEVVKQSFVFASSPLTWYTDLDDKELQRKGCECEAIGLDVPKNEARIYRVYESGEILSVLRLPGKLLLNLDRHINEIRFNQLDQVMGKPVSQHSMYDFTMALKALADQKTTITPGSPWFAGVGTHKNGESCSSQFEAHHNKICYPEDPSIFDGQVCPPATFGL